MHSCIFGLSIMIIIIVPIVGTLKIFGGFLKTIILVFLVLFKGYVVFCIAKIRVFIDIISIILYFREVVGSIFIEIEDIVLGGRLVVWIVFHVLVPINGFVVTVSEYETPSRFITTC